MKAAGREDRCQNPQLNEALPSFCFGELTEAKRDAVALHLLECDACWTQVQTLEACVRTLRFDPRLAPMIPTPAALSVLSVSGQLEVPFGGHKWFATTIAALYGLLFGASVWTELAYSYDRFGGLAWALSPAVLAAVGGAVLVAMFLDARLTFRGSHTGLLWSAGIVLAVVGASTVVLFWLLPHEPTILASFQTRSAASGYQKNVLYYFLPLLLFVLPTFHAILAFQRQLLAGRHQQVLSLLAGDVEGVTPRGAWLVPMWALGGVLALAAVIGYQGSHNMLDHLKPGPYAELFTFALHTRVALWFVLAVISMGWYQLRLNEIKREALDVLRLTEPSRHGHTVKRTPTA